MGFGFACGHGAYVLLHGLRSVGVGYAGQVGGWFTPFALRLAGASPRFRNLSFGAQYMPLGGLLSGFFGGLSGMQGALRSAFLSRAGLTKEAFIATGAVIACFIDFSRLVIYSTTLVRESVHLNYGLLAAAVLAAFLGAALGNNYLKKMTMRGIQRIVAAMLFGVALGLVSGLL